MLKPLVWGLLGSATLLGAPASATDIFAGERAQQIAQETLIIDTHIDVPWRLMNDWEDMTGAAERGDYDYARARDGGLNVPFMAIYIPSQYEDDGAYTLANQLIDYVESMVYRAPDKYAIPHSTSDLKAHQEAGLISLAMGMENGAPIEGDLDNLEHFYQRGVRYITLAHSEDNHIADSSYDERQTWGGLSPFGAELVREMNRIGMIVDVSHISDEAFYDVLEVSSQPVLATHSSARAFTPGWQRNMSDEMIKALAAQGGVIQVTFGSAFLTEEANQYRARIQQKTRDIEREYGARSQRATQEIAKMQAANPYPFATYEDVLDHFDHIIDLVGIEHVGIGSDYDGVGDTLPQGLKDVRTFPNLIQGFLDRGYSESDIEKILYKNTLRVWRAVESARTE
jgi:membrane dipeptidase